MPIFLSSVISFDSKTLAVFTGMAASLTAIEATLAAMLTQQEKLMAAIDDLTANMATLSADISTFSTDFSAVVAALQAAVGNNDTAAIAAAADTMKQMDAQVQAMDATAKSLVPPPTSGPASSRS